MKSMLVGAMVMAGAVCLGLAYRSVIRDQSMKNVQKDISVRLINRDGTLTEPVQTPAVVRSEEQWRTRLGPEQYTVARSQATERPFCGAFHDQHRKGIYACVGCGLPLFRADEKFDSGTGWPSFFQPVASENVSRERDFSFGMIREEVHCSRCGTHLGHVFPDGPAPIGLRFCINSAALTFDEDGPARETVIFGAGCFWGVEEAFGRQPGVLSTEAGYSGGITRNPTYEEVCSHKTGHAEVVKVEFDPKVVTFEALLDLFFEIHNPTTRDRQGFDIGSNYRSAIFFTNPFQEAAARKTIARLQESGAVRRPIVTEVDVAGPFYRAEEYHQKYAERHGGGFCHVSP